MSYKMRSRRKSRQEFYNNESFISIIYRKSQINITMKQIKVIKSKDEIIKEMLTSMLASICKQKECIEQLLDAQKAIRDTEAESKWTSRQKCNLLHGVGGLATHLGCGRNKAQQILNSKVLQDNGIAYRTGTRWIINAVKLNELLANEPDAFMTQRKNFD